MLLSDNSSLMLMHHETAAINLYGAAGSSWWILVISSEYRCQTKEAEQNVNVINSAQLLHIVAGPRELQVVYWISHEGVYPIVTTPLATCCPQHVIHCIDLSLSISNLHWSVLCNLHLPWCDTTVQQACLCKLRASSHPRIINAVLQQNCSSGAALPR